MSSRKDKDKKAEAIEEPTEVDVLCGRGGMSNHHPGNEWYRRLIRSNRPLYRACPKHTKLLVSKAIVQAVEQQGGRFLEKDKRSNMFTKVPYKRAVDKTSQGLRERNREDDDSDDDSEEDEDEQPQRSGSNKKRANRERMVVPEEFSGRNKTPNMSDLATVAIGMTTRGASGSFSPNKRQKYQVVVGKKSRSDLLADDDDDEDDDDDNNDEADDNAGGSSGRRDAMQLPPPLHSNQTSTFRLLNQPNIPSQRSAPNGELVSESSLAFLPSFSQAFGISQPPGHQPAVSHPINPAVAGIYMVNPAAPNPVSFLPLPMSDTAPPPLSRVATQVSDWLSSFYPVPTAPGQETKLAGIPQSDSIPRSISNQLKIPAPLDDDKPQIQTLPPPTRRITHMQQRVQQKQQLAKVAAQQKAVFESPNAGLSGTGSPHHAGSPQQIQLEAWQRFQAQQAAIKKQYEQQDYDPSGDSALNVAPTRIKRKTSLRTSRLHTASHDSYSPTTYSGDAQAYHSKMASRNRNERNSSLYNDNSEDDGDAKLAAAAPTELEHSVSATLLKLASGRLESGITTFFDRQDSVQTVEAPSDSSESSDTLLGDHHDTEAESRLRVM